MTSIKLEDAVAAVRKVEQRGKCEFKLGENGYNRASDAAVGALEALAIVGYLKGATHDLKTLPQFWDAVERGDKTFEVRLNDRGFQKGDQLVLHRLGPDGKIDGTFLRRVVTYVLPGGQYGIDASYCVLGLGEAP